MKRADRDSGARQPLSRAAFQNNGFRPNSLTGPGVAEAKPREIISQRHAEGAPLM